jgi:ABC-2 type transport system permease protein
MGNILRIVVAEARRELLRARAYWLEVLADQVLFTLGFLLLSGLFYLVAEGEYGDRARLASLVGFVIWRVADGCILRTVDSLSDDAQAGTLEQIWLSGVSPQLVLLARSVAILLYHGARGLLLAAVIMLLLQITPAFPSGAAAGTIAAGFLVFLLTQAGAFGVAFMIAGLHLAYKNVAALTLAVSTALLFLTGALAPLEGAPVLTAVSRALPLTLGIELSRQLAAGEATWTQLWQQPDFYWLLVNTAFYGLLGWLVMGWGQRLARRDGSLAHY